MNKIECIHVAFLHFQQGSMNIVSYLAQQGYDAQVNHVLALGGSYYDAIYGYALSGNLNSISTMQGAKSDTKEHGLIVRGLAAGGHWQLLRSLPYAHEYLAEQIYGFALAGEETKVLTLVQEHSDFFTMAIRGYATENHGALLKKLLPGTAHYLLAVDCAARAGHIELVHELFHSCGISFAKPVNGLLPSSMNEHNTMLLINRAAMSFVAGGHYQAAADLLELGANARQCLASLSDFGRNFKPEVALVLLAHMQKVTSREHMIEQMKLYAAGAESAFNDIDFTHNQDLQKLMHDKGINFIEAEAMSRSDTYCEHRRPISLDYLAEIITQQSLQDLPEHTSCSIGATK